MTFARVLLGLTGLMFAGYGLACLFIPSLPADYSGIALPNASAITEVVAMYGGLQTAIGALLLYFAAAPERVSTGLFVLVILIGGLGLSRAFGVLIHGATPYNLSAMAFELTTALLGVIAMRGTKRQEVPA
jgi:hypothetical protein